MSDHWVKLSMCLHIVNASAFSAFLDLYNCMAFSPKATGSCWKKSNKLFLKSYSPIFLWLAQNKDLESKNY